MSLPLTRRIARAALIVAAGAAPVVGAAGSASAAGLPSATDHGITALDGANVGDAIDDASRNATELASDAGDTAVKKTVPPAGHALGKSAKATLPAAQRFGGTVAGTAGEVVGDTAGSATKGGLPTDVLGKGAPTGHLPVQGVQGLPLN